VYIVNAHCIFSLTEL